MTSQFFSKPAVVIVLGWGHSRGSKRGFGLTHLIGFNLEQTLRQKKNSPAGEFFFNSQVVSLD